MRAARNDPPAAWIPYAAVVAILLSAPFERLQPALSFPGQELSNLEAVVLGALLAWIAWVILARQTIQLKTGLSAPVLWLVAVMLVSALISPEHTTQSLRFVGRFLVGFLVFLLVTNAVNSRFRFNGALIAVALVGTCVSLLGLLEHHQVEWVEEWLRPFRPSASWAAGVPRITSTLPYPTVTSMYLEVTFGLTCALLLLAAQSRRWGLLGLVFTALVLIGNCIILSLTRSGLLSMGVVLLAAGFMWWRARGLDRGLAAILGLSLVLGSVFGYRVWSEPGAYWLRLTTQGVHDWYRAEYFIPESLQLRPGQFEEVELTITNTGLATWNPEETSPVRLSYHWLDPTTLQVPDFEGLRTELPRTVEAGRTVSVGAQVQAPYLPGQYVLVWDMLREGLFWFSLEGAPTAYTRVEVTGPISKGLPTRPLEAMPAPRFVLSRWQLWSTALGMIAANPILGVGPDNFRLLYGRYAGLEIWDRSYHTNNLYLEFFVCTGFLGGGLFSEPRPGQHQLWLLWRLFVILRRQWKRATQQTLSHIVGISAATSAILVHGFFDYFLEFTPTYLMIWSTLGLAAAALRLEED